jgi:uncharacterized protein YndB with AHSA1/START domain/predicted enzyme related to lactoylglutathione lyase
VGDVPRSTVFYGRTLGLPEILNQGIPGDVWFECANGLVLGLSAKEPGMPDQVGTSKLLIRVDDLKAIGERLLKAGVKVEPPELTGDRIVAWDPDGNRLYLVEGRGVAPGMMSRTRLADGNLMLMEEATARGTPDELWPAMIDPALISAWLCGGPAWIDPRPGGKLQLTFPHIGRPHTTWQCEILEVNPCTRVRFRDEVLGLEITFDLTPLQNRRTMVRLSLAPVDLSMLGDDAKGAANSLALNWRRILRNLVLLMDDELDPEEPTKGSRPR